MRIFDHIVSRIPIDKGWSGDQKYCAVTDDGKKYLLRIASDDRLEQKRREYEKMTEVAQLGIPMCLPVEFGSCEEGAYSIQSWIDGEDAEERIVSMDADSQYRYGLDAGRILGLIHTIPAPLDVPDWAVRFNAKIDRKIAMYESSAIKYEQGDDAFLRYIANNRHLLERRPQCYQHGDYHVGNMMIDSNGVLTIIDFDRDDYGDPWEEFNRIVWYAPPTPPSIIRSAVTIIPPQRKTISSALPPRSTTPTIFDRKNGISTSPMTSTIIHSGPSMK